MEQKLEKQLESKWVGIEDCATVGTEFDAPVETENGIEANYYRINLLKYLIKRWSWAAFYFGFCKDKIRPQKNEKKTCQELY